MATLVKKSFSTPDEVRTPPKTKVEVVKLGDKVVSKMTFEPGWKWSEHIKPTAGTDSCQVHHFGYQVSGVMHVKMDDGTEAESNAGDVVEIAPGHDGWVVGNEPVVVIDFTGGGTYAK